MPTADDDTRWTPIEAAHQQRTERTGNERLAAMDLMKELAEGRLRCMARSFQGDRTLVAPAEWVEQLELAFMKKFGGLNVFSRLSSSGAFLTPVATIAVTPTRWGITGCGVRFAAGFSTF